MKTANIGFILQLDMEVKMMLFTLSLCICWLVNLSQLRSTKASQNNIQVFIVVLLILVENCDNSYTV